MIYYKRLRVYLVYCILILAIIISACVKEHKNALPETYHSKPFTLEEPAYFVKMVIPDVNGLTVEGVELGRRLFYDPILSIDSTQSCSSCHIQSLAFTDGKSLSTGVHGEQGRRNAMSLANVGYYYKGLFWDGRSDLLEHQALEPVVDPIELANQWSVVEARIKKSAPYLDLFEKAFGIKHKDAIDSSLIVNALAQFERTLISHDAKFDQVERGEAQFTASEQRGFDIFFDASPTLPDAECGHCHNEPLFTNLDFENNGIQAAESIETYADRGRWEVTGRWVDNGKFRVPSLRNIAITAPYMHDGSLATLDEVLEHYNSGGHFAKNVSPNVRRLNLSHQNKKDLIAFLETLTDSVFLTKPAFSNPFLKEGEIVQ